MKVIKFRGRDIETNQWVYGNLTQFNHHFPVISWYENTESIEKGHNCVVFPDSVCMFVGLFDKKRTEVYEGDILGKGKNTCTIEWNQYLCQFQCKWNNKNRYSDIYHIINDGFVVIGNIYD